MYLQYAAQKDGAPQDALAALANPTFWGATTSHYVLRTEYMLRGNQQELLTALHSRIGRTINAWGLGSQIDTVPGQCRWPIHGEASFGALWGLSLLSGREQRGMHTVYPNSEGGCAATITQNQVAA
jgi:hypothetical protein